MPSSLFTSLSWNGLGARNEGLSGDKRFPSSRFQDSFVFKQPVKKNLSPSFLVTRLRGAKGLIMGRMVQPSYIPSPSLL